MFELKGTYYTLEVAADGKTALMKPVEQPKLGTLDVGSPDDVDESAKDPIQALAEKYFGLPCSVKTRNDALVETINERRKP